MLPYRPRTPRSRSVLALAAVALLALAPVAPAAAPDGARGLTVDDVAKMRSVGTVRVSPDGQHVAYTLTVPRDPYGGDDGPTWTELHVADRADGRSRPFVTGEVRVSSMSWTPDGSGIAFLAKRGDDEETALWVIPIDGGEALKVVEADESIAEYAFSPDGTSVAYAATSKEDKSLEKLRDKGFKAEIYEEQTREVHAWIAPLKAGGPASTKESRKLELDGSVSEIHWSPAGDHIALALAPTPLIDDHYMERRVQVVAVESGEIVASVANPGKLGDVRWSPDGKHLAMLSAADFNDPMSGRLTVVPATGGTPKGLLPADWEGDAMALAWSDASTVMFVAHEGVECWLGEVGVDGSGMKRLVQTGGPILNSLSVSGDGKYAAFQANTPAHPNEAYVLTRGDAGATRLTDSNPWMSEIRIAKQEAVRYKARDGLEVEGLLIRPLDEDGRHPLIVVVHGGPEAHYSNGWLTRYSSPGQFGAAEGYAVFYPNYRGSTGRGVAFSKLDQAAYAKPEFDDLVDGVDHLVKAGLVDREKVGVTGGSYGGFASAWCATALTEHFAASVMFVGISDQISKFGTTDIPKEMHAVHARMWPWDDWDFFRERSPVFHTEKARTPILILHGKEDTRVHPSQSMELYRYLKVLGNVPVRLVLYPGEGHGNRKAAAQYDYGLRMMRWMDHYLRGPGGDPPPHELDLDEDKLGLGDGDGDGDDDDDDDADD